jgi:HD-GYP domain-containing protein (c-di-GMP phosphodiesterase class II)
VNQEEMRLTEIQAPPNIYQGFLYFSLAALVPDTAAPCPVHLEAFNKSLGRLRLVEALSPGANIVGAWLGQLLDEGVVQAYIALEDLPALQTYMNTQTMQMVDQAPEQASKLVYENALCSIKSAMLDPKNGRRLAMAAATVRGMVQHLWEHEDARKDMLKLMTLSQELYTHSLNVCLLGLGMAMNMGWERKQVDTLGLALFFHDLGLAPETAKPGGYKPFCLQGEENLHHHPEESALCLKELPEANQNVLEIVRSHHENLDGSGYPRGLNAMELGPPARLARLVDTYELATSGCLRPKALSPFEALQLMRYEMRDQLDQDILGAFVLFLGQS